MVSSFDAPKTLILVHPWITESALRIHTFVPRFREIFVFKGSASIRIYTFSNDKYAKRIKFRRRKIKD